MNVILVSVLVLFAVLSFIPSGQRMLERISFGLLKIGAMPWIGLGATFLWTFRVFPNPNWRGIIFGVFVTGIAATLSFWAPRDPEIKSYVKNAFFGGKDIWELPNFNFYSGLLWGAGVALIIPWGGAFVNFAGLGLALFWIVWQAYKGNAEGVPTEPEADGSAGESA